MIINEDNEYETGDDVDPNAPEDDDYDIDGEDAYPSDARTIVVSQRALNVLPSASTQRCNLIQTKALIGPGKACKVIIDGGSPYLEFGDVFPDEVPAGLPPLRGITCWRFDGSLWREKTLLMLADHFYWPKMRRDVDGYVKRCITCNKSKSS
ncbi:hypothetical protein QYE76_025677 [Lolium multiflorum]|uniref:Integrase zinc-binding domain-containing protein n=1 Tax=Lolium multiflorum TaxID=4521 RepID=A0AAD8REV7_LOLMU|nr:hypothetical protein QYE76_025677 [Lolium multiflorum]